MLIEVVAYVVVSLYTFALASVTLYCIVQFHLLLQYRFRHRNKMSALQEAGNIIQQNIPFVTIQLPIYNERYVVERLLDNIVKINYPEDKFEIQVLDDSTDDTSEICRKKINEYAQKGFSIHHYQRSHRQGYKAGALRDGLLKAKGEFIAIFDADFIPKPDFLLQTIPYFNDPAIGVIQTRWEHLNEGYSFITRLQAFQLNVHFTIEQSGRQAGGYLLQFNGTAGVWRRDAIVDSGGWQSDTLTEDLDLSYRAQLKGWKIQYIQDIVSPAELPCEMNGLKSQQFRWMKGGAENARKLIPGILKSDISLIKKMHATSHLLSSTVFLFVFILAVLSVPALFLMSTIRLNVHWYGIFMIGMLATGAVYYVANEDTTWNHEPPVQKIFKFAFIFPVFICLSMGLSLHNSIAVIEGYLGKKSTFVRTPKFNIQQVQDSIKAGFYKSTPVPPLTIIEGILAFYFLIAIIAGVELGKTSFIFYHFMLMVGFGSICMYSIKHGFQR